MRKRLTLGLMGLVGLAAVTGGVALAPPASAGGWAISSLDAVPAPAAGEEVGVGFTILQHGITPATEPAMVDGPPVEVVVDGPDGRVAFLARAEGPPGHWVADVTFPEASTVDWWIEQGWFGPYELGSLDVAPAPSGSGAGSSASTSREWSVPLGIRLLLPVAVVAGLALVVDDQRRRRLGPQVA